MDRCARTTVPPWQAAGTSCYGTGLVVVGTQLEVDVNLLRGFRYSCRPDCGLCCYAEPRIESVDRPRLLQIAPDARFVRHGPDSFLAARSDGGACQFLSANRCEVHVGRPHPCREFPVTVHVGRRLQASVVLSCPGVDLTPLGAEDPGADAEAQDFAAEMSSIRSRLGPVAAAQVATAVRRGRKVERALRAEGRWQDDEEVRATLRSRLPRSAGGDFPVEDPPEISEGLDRLPLFFDGRAAPLALGRGLGGWEVLQLSASGGAESIAVIPPPERPPALDTGAVRFLDGYLRYSLERDAFLAAVHLDALHANDGSVLEWAVEELRALGAIVVARAVVRAKLRGRGDAVLTQAEVADGVRATDMDSLDRPTWGDRL